MFIYGLSCVFRDFISGYESLWYTTHYISFHDSLLPTTTVTYCQKHECLESSLWHIKPYPKAVASSLRPVTSLETLLLTVLDTVLILRHFGELSTFLTPWYRSWPSKFPFSLGGGSHWLTMLWFAQGQAEQVPALASFLRSDKLWTEGSHCLSFSHVCCDGPWPGRM